MSFRPYSSRGGFILLGATLVTAAAAFLLFSYLVQQRDPAGAFLLFLGLLLLLVLAGLALYGTVSAFTLRYHLNRNGIVIRWGLIRQQIPFNQVIHIISGQTVDAPTTFRGLNIAGLQFGSGELAAFSTLTFRSTAPLSQSLLIVTKKQTYIISPQQPEVFLQAWRARQELGPTQQWTETIDRRWPLDAPMLDDRLSWGLLGLGTLLLLALLGYVSLNYQSFPQALPIHFDNLGQADRIAPKSSLFLLPATGAIVWLLNTTLGSLIFARQPAGAYLLWGSSIAVQLGLWVALLTITAG